MNDYYPPIEPYDSGHFTPNGFDQIYYEQCGNPDGYPILYVHGGPGGGCDADDRRFFDPEKWRIILFDQRGCGRSRPNAVESITVSENTTHALMEDMRMLIAKLGISKVVLFGGSWGSTLSLAYAIRYPETVAGMILRGIFLGDSADIKHYTCGGLGTLFPEAWERFISHVPSKGRSDPGSYYLNRMLSNSDGQAQKFAYEWVRYELSSMYVTPLTQEEIKERTGDSNMVNWAVLEAWYINFQSNCFLLPDKHIIQNTKSLLEIPTTIIHGRYDAVCPLSNALKLHHELPLSRLFIEPAGHSCIEPAIKVRLLNETNNMYDLLTKK